MAYIINGKVIDATTKQGIADLRIEAWGNILKEEVLVSRTVSDASGQFGISFTDQLFSELFPDCSPKLFFKIFQKDIRIFSTKNRIYWEKEINISDFTIEVPGIPSSQRVINPNIPLSKPNIEKGNQNEITQSFLMNENIMNNNQKTNNVFGRVTDRFNRPLPNLLVRIFAYKIRDEIQLGQCITDKNGKYEIPWSIGQAEDRNNKDVDISFKVLTQEKGTLLYSSAVEDVRFNASSREEINIIITKVVKSEAIEFDFILSQLTKLAGSIPISELEESLDHQDITLLSKQAHISAEKIEYFVLAHRLHNISKIDPAFFYALFRKNTLLKNDLEKPFQARLKIDLNADPQILIYDAALLDSEIIKKDVDSAVLELIVNKDVADRCPEFIKQIHEYKDKAEEYYKNEHIRRIFDIISRFVLGNKLEEMAELFKANTCNLNAFFDKIFDSSFFATKDDKNYAQASLILGELLGFDDLIINQVSVSQKIKRPEEIKNLARLNKAEWTEELTRASEKNSIDKDKIDIEVIDLRASLLARTMEKKFPTVAFTAQLERNGTSTLKNHQEITDFLAEYDDFDLQKSNVDQFMTEKNIGKDKSESIIHELKSIQRICKMLPTPKYSITMGLLDQNINSANNIASIGQSRFVNEIAPKVGLNTKEAETIFRNAEQTTMAATLIIRSLGDTLESMNIPALGSNVNPAILAKLKQDFPNLKTLFNTTDTCECEHCRSVISPSAYFVEILQFLDKRIVIDTTNGNSSGCIAKDKLFERRPDLGEIDLSCENSNTPLPYIDLVCEILEEVVSPDPGISYTGNITDGADPLEGKISQKLYGDLTNPLSQKQLPVSPDSIIFKTDIQNPVTSYLRDKKIVCKITQNSVDDWTIKRLHQTLSPAEELAAAPEYVNQDAYNTLAASEYAFKLPFDLNHTEAKAYFDRFGISRSELMKDFQKNSSPSDIEIATEHLGLTAKERDIIITPKQNEPDQKSFWNPPTQWDDPFSSTNGQIFGNVLAYMKRVDHFLDKTGLAYKELDLLLKLKFIDPLNNLYIKHQYDDPIATVKTISCNTAKKEIANLDFAGLDRIHRFLRLQKKTGLKFEVLDEIVSQSYLGNNKFDGECLLKASDLLKLSEETGIKLDELIGFYSEIPHTILNEDVPKPLYYKIFLNKSKNGYVNEDFLPANINGLKKLSEYKTYLSLCLQLSEQDLEKLITIRTNIDLTFSNLSFLYAVSRLMKKLKLKVDDFIILSELTGIDIQNSPADTLVFVKAAELVKDLPLKLADIKFMLRHEPVNSLYNDLLSADDQKPLLQVLLSKLSGLIPDDVAKIIGFIDKDWPSPGDAVSFIRNKLDVFFNTDNIVNALNALAASTAPIIDPEKKILIKAFMDAMSHADKEVKDDKILQILSQLQKTYQNIFSVNKALFDPNQSVEEQKVLLRNTLSKLNGIGEEDVKTFLQIIERDWTLGVDATDIVTNKLTSLLGAKVVAINNKINILDIAFDEISFKKNDLIDTFILSIDEGIDVFSLSIYEKLNILQNLLSSLSEVNSDDVLVLLKFIESNRISSFFAINNMVQGKLKRSELDTTDIETCITNLWTAPVAAVEENQRLLIKAFLDSLASYQSNITKSTFLEQTIATTFKTDLDLIKIILKYAKLKQTTGNLSIDLINNLLTTEDLIDKDNPTPVLPIITEMTFPRQFQSIRLLHKMIPFINSFKLDNSTIEWFFKNNLDLDWFEWDDIPYQVGQTVGNYEKYAEFVEMVNYSKQLTPLANPADAENPITFFTVMEMLLQTNTNRSDFINALSLLTGINKDNIDAIDNYFGFFNSNLNSYKKPNTWKILEKCDESLRKLSLPLEQVKDLIKPVLMEAEVKTLRAALKSKYDEDSWLSTLKEIMDTIRPQKRNALVAYLLAGNPEMKDENDLFDYFLVDVEMEACMPSSRIVLAHGTVQLFVQRCLMGLEPEAAADVTNDKSWEQWKWMKNYRVWEANRKVFMYPENWIEPELRDDKSFLFTELENELKQNELTDLTAEDALVKYLEKLDNIAFLEIMATWYQSDIKTMHVFARTKGGDPAIYYYRKFEQERYWTPWEKVDLDITGDHLLAFVRNNRITLAWPIFSEEPEENPTATIPTQNPPNQTQSLDKPKKKLKIQLAISELANKKWQPKKISKDGIRTPKKYTSEINDLDREKYNLIYFEISQQVCIFSTDEAYNSREFKQNDKSGYSYIEKIKSHHIHGIFNITGCKGYSELVVCPEVINSFPDFLPDFKDTWLKSQRYNELNQIPADELSVRNGVSFYNFYEILGKTPGIFRVSYPHQLTKIDLVAFFKQYFLKYLYCDRIMYQRNRSFKIPLGTLLPYFIEDSNHAYVIIPGFYKSVTESNTNDELCINRTASNAINLIEDAIALFNKYVEQYKKDQTGTIKMLLQDPDYLEIVKEYEVFKSLPYKEQFKNLYHPLICQLRKTLYKDGIPELMKRETQLQKTSFNFENHYSPNPDKVIKSYILKESGVDTLSYPVEDLDFSSDGSYSSYNWELFFHVPFLLATKLTKNQRFEDALTWFHYMFNPTGALPGDIPQKYWVTKPFFETHGHEYIEQRIDSLMHGIADPSNPERIELEFAIDQWRTKPFKPHVVARFRPVAYQKALLMKYLDNLTEWGDYLFRQDTMESIVQATQMYILADKLLGPKPRIIPSVIKTPYETYNQLEAKLDAFGNALIDLENILPDLSKTLPEGGAELPTPMSTLSMLYFCIPKNDKMLEYWDRIADRLFKIRHCQDFNGIERSLALFAPPIDPGMLVRAAAAGLDISSILAGINAPMPYYRFNVMSQKATELANEVRGLGSSLLQALEKKDAEAMSLLRSELEIKVLNAVRDMKQLQIKESKEQIEVLKRTKKVTEERKAYYANIKRIIPNEQLNLDKLSESHGFQVAAQGVKLAASIISYLPDIDLGLSGFGGSPIAKAKIGGLNLGQATNAASDILSFLSMLASNEAARASILGGYDRRFDDWKFQERLAKLELNSIEKQITAAEIRKEIAEIDLRNHDLQIENAKKSDEFMRSKFTNKELYDWMIGQVSSVYFSAYQMAHDFAKKAERCYQFELGNDDTFISYGYWDSMKKGLQSADHLIHDIKRMETSYLDKNKREYEITKHISLAMLDPLALLRLRATGKCDIEVPEVLYDMDHPGQYFRRLKSVSISMPCIAGPYTSISAKLSLIKNKYRKNANSPTNYTEDPNGGDERFNYNIGAIQSIATSNAQNDSGVFELNFRDERYLPFEGTGAISTWQLELPNKVKQFDYNTISDVIIHVKYTAREGGSTLRTAVESKLIAQLIDIKQELAKKGLHIALNLKHDMPNIWHLLKQNKTVDLKIDKSRLPFLAQALVQKIDYVIFVAKSSSSNPPLIKIDTEQNGSSSPTDLNLSNISGWKDLLLGEYISQGQYNNDSSEITLNNPFNITISKAHLDTLEELMLVVKYKFT